MKRLYLEHAKQLTYEQLAERRKEVAWERTKHFVNRLANDVYIRDRAGFLTRLSPRLNSKEFEADFLYICDQISCTPDAKAEYIRQARATDQSMRQFEHDAVLEHWTGTTQASARYGVEVASRLSLKVLQEYDGVVYLEDHDVVVLYGLNRSDMESIQHPYSKAGYMVRSFSQISENNDKLRKGDFTLNIRIVDNTDSFGSRWILMEETPFCIVAGRDPEYTDGVYVTYSKNLMNGTGPQKLLTDRFDFEDCEKKLPYKLYRSQQEALAARRSLEVEEAKLKIKELETKCQQAENNARKAVQDRENAEKEAALKQKQAEREEQLRQTQHEQTMERIRREREKIREEHELWAKKHYGEMLSTDRKNTLEVIKCVPMILSGALAILTALKKK